MAIDWTSLSNHYSLWVWILRGSLRCLPMTLSNKNRSSCWLYEVSHFICHWIFRILYFWNLWLSERNEGSMKVLFSHRRFLLSPTFCWRDCVVYFCVDDLVSGYSEEEIERANCEVFRRSTFSLFISFGHLCSMFYALCCMVYVQSNTSFLSSPPSLEEGTISFPCCSFLHSSQCTSNRSHVTIE